MTTPRKPSKSFLVEDNAADAELTLHALTKSKLANKILRVQDGEEALDFLFCRGNFSELAGSEDAAAALCFWISSCPRWMAFKCCGSSSSNPRTQAIPVIVLTSSKEERDSASAAINYGVEQLHPKTRELQRTFRRWCRQFGHVLAAGQQ